MPDLVRNNATKVIKQAIGHSRYHLEVHDCPHFLDVLRFQAAESLSHPWYYTICVTCATPDIVCDTLLLKPASFTLQTPVFTGAPALPVRSIYGVVQSFRHLATSAEETRYALTLVPRIARLQHTKNNQIYLNQSVPEVVELVLRKHGLEGPDFEFRLSQVYPMRELITQWRETDLEFVQRLLAEVGIFWRFAMDDRLGQDLVIFQDTQQHYQFGVTLPLRNPAGMSDNGQDSVWDIQTAYHVVSERVTTRDYNYRQALTPQDSTESINRRQDLTTGEVYRDPGGDYFAKRDPERQTRRLVAHLEKLGHLVTLEPATSTTTNGVTT